MVFVNLGVIAVDCDNSEVNSSVSLNNSEVEFLQTMAQKLPKEQVNQIYNLLPVWESICGFCDQSQQTIL